MKREPNNQIPRRNVRLVCAPRLLLAAGSAALLATTPLADLHAQINGNINGSTIMQNVGDDSITVSTINISYFTQCYFIANGMSSNAAWGSYVFAGQGVASGVPNISSSDFTVTSNTPWIGTSTANVNYLGLPSGDKIYADGLNGSRGSLNNAEAGGMSIGISYTPKNGDPTSINFVQAYIENINGTGFTTGVIDAPPTAGTPFYNSNSVAGTGTNLQLRTSPLMTSGTVPGWLGDQPYDNEWGAPPTADDTITNTTVTFQTFIEGIQNIGGTNYNVLYGGIQWGYSFNTMDLVPEPGSVALATTAVLMAALAGRYRRAARNRKD
jgi:hypothetical protein